MNWSLGEVRTLAIKASRGAGLPWGMAEEGGAAVHWLQSYGAPGALAFARYLDWRDHQAVIHDLCPICLGTAIMDAGRKVPARIGRVRQPLLLAPFIAQCVPSGMRLNWDGVEIAVSEAGMVSSASRDALLMDEAECSVERCAARVAETRLRVPDDEADAIARLQAYAARIYAPATEASRMSGAGAGVTDND